MKSGWKVAYFNFEEADQGFKDAFEGWSIVRMATLPDHQYDPLYKGSGGVTDSSVEGGLTFFLEKGSMRRRVILGYTELGEWIEHIKESWEDDAPLRPEPSDDTEDSGDDPFRSFTNK